MNILVVRTAAFVIGSSIAGCVYATHAASNVASAAASPLTPIAVYPGARHTVGDPGGDGADVDLHLAVVSLHIEAARYDSTAAPASVVDFYRKTLARIGRVKVSRGGTQQTHLRGFDWDASPDQITVETGGDIVSVKPRGSGTEFAIMRIVPEPASPSTSH